MSIAKDKMVSLTYELRLEGANGDVFETAGSDNPLTFMYGAGMMLPKFESELEGKAVGDKFEVAIDAANAYGEVNEAAVIELPKNVFEVNGEFDAELVKVGNTVPMMSTSGQRMNGIVLAVEEATVKMDFNHPLAGEDLHFKGEILEVREATAEELAAVANQGGCGCDSGSCGDGDCGDGGCGTSEGGGCCC